MVEISIDRQSFFTIDNDVVADGNLGMRHHRGRPVAFEHVWATACGNRLEDTLLSAGECDTAASCAASYLIARRLTTAQQ